MAKRKPTQKTAYECLVEWLGWINSTNAELLAKAFEEWMEEQGYRLQKIEKEKKK